jgi:hypothetical protein
MLHLITVQRHRNQTKCRIFPYVYKHLIDMPLRMGIYKVNIHGCTIILL